MDSRDMCVLDGLLKDVCKERMECGLCEEDSCEYCCINMAREMIFAKSKIEEVKKLAARLKAEHREWRTQAIRKAAVTSTTDRIETVAATILDSCAVGDCVRCDVINAVENEINWDDIPDETLNKLQSFNGNLLDRIVSELFSEQHYCADNYAISLAIEEVADEVSEGGES